MNPYQNTTFYYLYDKLRVILKDSQLVLAVGSNRMCFASAMLRGDIDVRKISAELNGIEINHQKVDQNLMNFIQPSYIAIRYDIDP